MLNRAGLDCNPRNAKPERHTKARSYPVPQKMGCTRWRSNKFSRKLNSADFGLANPGIKLPSFAEHLQMRTSASFAPKTLARRRRTSRINSEAAFFCEKSRVAVGMVEPRGIEPLTS